MRRASLCCLEIRDKFLYAAERSPGFGWTRFTLIGRTPMCLHFRDLRYIYLARILEHHSILCYFRKNNIYMYTPQLTQYDNNHTIGHILTNAYFAS